MKLFVDVIFTVPVPVTGTGADTGTAAGIVIFQTIALAMKRALHPAIRTPTAGSTGAVVPTASRHRAKKTKILPCILALLSARSFLFSSAIPYHYLASGTSRSIVR